MSYETLVGLYLALILLPWVLSYVEGLAVRGWYEEFVGLLSIIGLSMLLAQFALTSRVDAIAHRAGVDNTMRVHTKFGEIVAYLILLHPFLIVAPRLIVAPSFALDDVWDMFTQPETSTGLYAWSLLLIWVLMAVFKERTGLTYEAWRYTHGVGFVAIVVLATHHAVTVGRHARFNLWFEVMWITLGVLAVAIVVYVYFIRPRLVARKPFRVVECQKDSSDDWYLTIEKDGDFPFEFDAGQFTWISTSDSIFARNEHPFSIATSTSSLPQISYVIRELGDYTRQLDRLKVGQRVWLDGPHGVFTLNARNAQGIVLIAGGAGIGPIMGILRELADNNDPRPIKLIYGNRVMDQMLFLDELQTMRENLDLDMMPALEIPPDSFEGHQGFIDVELLGQVVRQQDCTNWDFYVCGPEAMVKAVASNLRRLSVPRDRILFEQLGF